MKGKGNGNERLLQKLDSCTCIKEHRTIKNRIRKDFEITDPQASTHSFLVTTGLVYGEKIDFEIVLI